MAISTEKRVAKLEKIVRILSERGPGPDVAALCKGFGKDARDDPESDEGPGGADQG